MTQPISSQRQGLIAYIAPFAVYMLVNSVESKGWLGLAHEYEILCSVKGLMVAAVLCWFRREYPPLACRGWGLGIAAGIAGLILWIALDRLQTAIPGFQNLVDSIMPGGRAGYDPFGGDEKPAALRYGFIVVRLLELAIIVPIMEELFWRGFLARFLLADDFRSAPQGKFTPFSFWVVTLAFTSVHPEILAAMAWGALINGVYRRTENLWACVAMHATTNALLGAYILATGNWRLW